MKQDLVWQGGSPPPLAPDNPYLPALNTFPNRHVHLLKRGQAEHPFYLVWAAAGPGSKHRDNVEWRKLALEEYDKATLQRVTKPSAFWDIYADLECLLLWQLEGKTSKEQIATWQRRLRPSIEANIKSVTDTTSWIEWAANTLLQSAAILELAATSYGRENPGDPDLARWRAVASENLRKALRIQLPGGAFSYIRHSGPDPVYFAFDAAHLGRYYQLTGDASAKAALVRMAKWSSAATRCGWITPFSSPWWKHITGWGGPYTGPETLTTLANHPGMSGLMAKRRTYIQPYVWSYGNMYGWTPPTGPVKPITDRCEFDRNANGPALRAGGFDVEMPARAWGDSQFGASFATEKQIRSCVSAVYLAANLDNAKPAVRFGHHAYIMLSEPGLATHRGIVGRGWIAGAGTFDAHLGVCGDVPPDRSPWRRTDVWFADADGAAGALELTCQAAVTVQGVELMLSTRMDKLTLGPGKVGFKDFEVVVGGADLAAPAIGKGHTFFAYFPLVGAGRRAYRPGETFRAWVSLRRPGRPILTVGRVATTDGLYRVEVSKDGKRRAELLYNATPQPCDVALTAPATVWRSAAADQPPRPPSSASGRITLGPYGLLVIGPD